MEEEELHADQPLFGAARVGDAMVDAQQHRARADRHAGQDRPQAAAKMPWCILLPLAAFSPPPCWHPIPLAPPKLVGGRVLL